MRSRGWSWRRPASGSDRPAELDALQSPEVRAVADAMTFTCATDGNHGRSVAWGAQRVGAKAAIFVHGDVSEGRVAAIARYGARMIRVAGTYDDSVAEAARIGEASGWTVVSDTAWPGYERIPLLVMQGYTALASEALHALEQPPTHVFVQAGVGGVAAALAGHLALVLQGPAAEVRGGRSGARGLHLRDRAGGASGQDRPRRADRDGDARMLRAVAGGVARAGARG